MKTTSGFTRKPTTSASAAFLLVVSVLLNNISEIVVTASSQSSSDHLINLEEGRKQCSADGKTMKKLFDEYLVPVLDKYAERFPWTQQMAFYGTDKNNEVIGWNWVGGYKDWETMEPATEDTLVAGGSTTKPVTASAIMQHIQLGTTVISDVDGKAITIDTDVTANHFVNDLLRKSMNGNTMETLFPKRGNDGWGSDITVGHLLDQTSCIADYVDPEWSVPMELSCNTDKTIIETPFDYIRNPNNGKYLIHPECELGKHRWYSYSGIGYILLGLVLTKLQGSNTWDQLDQLSMFPKDWQDGVAFSMQECAEYGSNTGGQYFFGGNLTNFQSCGKVESLWGPTSWGESIKGPVFVDLGMDGDCMNGYTMGNGAYTAKWYSKFQHSLYTGKLPLPDGSESLNMKSVQRMVPPKCEVKKNSNGDVVPVNEKEYVANGCTNSFDSLTAKGYQGTENEGLGAYGYATMLTSIGPNITNDESKWNQSYVFGHGGSDYATAGSNYFFTDGKFSIARMYGANGYDYSNYVNWGRNDTTGECDCLHDDGTVPGEPDMSTQQVMADRYKGVDLILQSFAYEICHKGESFSLDTVEEATSTMFCGSDDPGCRKFYDWYLSQDGSTILECLAEAGGVQKTSALFEDSDMTCKATLEASSVNISRSEKLIEMDRSSSSSDEASSSSDDSNRRLRGRKN